MQESSVQSQDIKAVNTVLVPVHSLHSLLLDDKLYSFKHVGMDNELKYLIFERKLIMSQLRWTLLMP